ncbi:MAG: hypothetical protein KAU20_00345, partial [Nanoarchaeota archaeon]|nr:hypothetical protein [Nanoarchaeota archaeon]
TNITNLTGTSNSTNFSYTLPYENTFLWNCLGYDSDGHNAWSEEGNYTITLDTTAPTVTLLYPSNASTNDSATITFGFNTTENGACSLYLNSSGTFGINTTNSSITQADNNFVVTLTPDGDWLWNVECNDSAGNYANATNNWTLTISTNKAPNTTQVLVNSTPARSNRTNESLTCYAKADDSENATGLTAYYIWYNNTKSIGINGSTNSINNNTLSLIATLGYGNTTKNDNWTCSVMFSDALLNESDWNNATLTILNAAPIHSTPILNSSALENRTNETLSCYNQSTADIDDDNVVNYYRWYNNSVIIQELENLTTISTANTTKDANWTCEITPNDGTENGTALNSTSLIIRNTAPTHNTPILNSSALENRTNESLSCYNQSLNDIDSDTILVYVKWYVNGTIDNTLENLTTISSTNTTKDDNWSCEVTPFDGTDNGTAKNSTSLTIRNTAPIISSLNYPTDGLLLERALNATLNVTVTDLDEDVMNITFYNATDGIICINTNITSDSATTCNYTNLTAGKTYSWYVNVTDEESTTQSSIWSFTPNDEPKTMNMRTEDKNATSLILKWSNENDMEWISLKLGSDIMEVRKLTSGDNNWTISSLYADTTYNFTWQVGDNLTAFSDYYSFFIRTGWYENYTDYSYKRLITVNDADIDLENYVLNVSLNETNFDFTHMNWTTGNDIRFVNYRETKTLPYKLIYLNVTGNGGQEQQENANETGSDGNWVNLSYAYDGDWDTQASPDINTEAVYYANYTIPTGAKTTSTWRIYDGGWGWDLSLPSDCFGGAKLRFKVVANYSNPSVYSYCQNNSNNNWVLIRNNSHVSYYVYEEMVTWHYKGNLNVLVKPNHFDDETQGDKPGIDGNYNTKFWIYYNKSSASNESNSSLTYSGIWQNHTIGSEEAYSPPSPSIINVNETGKTDTSINISWTVDQITNNRIKYSLNEWFIGETWANRIINNTERFDHLSGDIGHIKPLIVYSDNYIILINVTCSNTSYSTNYSINSSKDPVEITFYNLNTSEYLNWTVNYTMNKTWDRATSSPAFKLESLTGNTTYYYGVWSWGATGNASERGNFTLGTVPSAPVVEIINYTEDRSVKQITICSNLTSLANQSNIACYFQYWINGTEDEAFNTTGNVTKNSVGTFCSDISVEYGNYYLYRAVAEGNETTGYSNAYENDFMAIQEFFAGSYVEDDSDGRSRQYCPPKSDGTINLNAACYEQKGYWEGSQQEETWIWIETNISDRGILKLYWWDGASWSAYNMTNDTDSDMQYIKMENLSDTWQTFYITNQSDNIVLNWTKPNVIHLENQNRTDTGKYVSFNGTPSDISYELLYLVPVYYNSSAYRWCMAAPTGNLYDCMSVEYFGGGREAGMGENMSGTAYDRGRFFRGGIANGEIYDSGVLNPDISSNREFGETDHINRHCYAFTNYWWNKTTLPANNITNYYYHYWSKTDWWSTYFGYPQSFRYDFVALFKWEYDSLSQTRDFSAIEKTKITEETKVNNVSSSIFNSSYNESLLIGHKSFDPITLTGYNGDEIYNFGFQTDGRWTNQMIGKYQQGFVIFNLPDNATLQGMDSDSDILNDYDELFVYYTNPKSADTDEDGRNDGNEIALGYDPNLYTDVDCPPDITTPQFNQSVYYTTMAVKVNATYTDPDNDNGTVYFRWYRNESNIFNQTYTNVVNGTVLNSGLGNDNFSKNDVINVTVYAMDSFSEVSATKQNDITIQNTAPTTTNPTLNTSTAYTDDTIICTNGSFSDIDNDVKSNDWYRWYKNGTLVSGETSLTLDLSIAGNGDKNDNINCEWIADDGTDNSSSGWLGSANLTINNAAPTHTTPILNSSALENRTNETLSCYNQSTADIDNDNIVNYYRWYNNSVIIQELENLTTISTTNTTKDSIWVCEITPFDGTENGTALNSTSLTIINTAPVNNGTIPNQTWDEDTSNLNAINLSSYFYDIDNDALSYTATGNSSIAVKIGDNAMVNFSQPGDWYGIEYVVFTANDGSLTAESNNITLTVNNVEEGGGGGGTPPEEPPEEDPCEGVTCDDTV